jgi:hypothetical protein
LWFVLVYNNLVRHRKLITLYQLLEIERIRGASVEQACAKALRSGRAVFHAEV